MAEHCDNCGEIIGSLETPHIWDASHVVCTTCRRLLEARRGTEALDVNPLHDADTSSNPRDGSSGSGLDELAALSQSSVQTRASRQKKDGRKSRHPSWTFPIAVVLVISAVILIVVIRRTLFSGGSDAVQSPSNAPKGKVRFTITWKYNDFVGNRGDTGAVVLLLPNNIRQKIPPLLVNPDFAEVAIGETRKTLAEYGAYIAVVGGDGKATISQVPSGLYTVIVISKNAKNGPGLIDNPDRRFGRYFSGDLGCSTCRSFFSEVDVPAGDEVEITHDFGFTGF